MLSEIEKFDLWWNGCITCGQSHYILQISLIFVFTSPFSLELEGDAHLDPEQQKFTKYVRWEQYTNAFKNF